MSQCHAFLPYQLVSAISSKHCHTSFGRRSCCKSCSSRTVKFSRKVAKTDKAKSGPTFLTSQTSKLITKLYKKMEFGSNKKKIEIGSKKKKDEQLHRWTSGHSHSHLLSFCFSLVSLCFCVPVWLQCEINRTKDKTIIKNLQFSFHFI